MKLAKINKIIHRYNVLRELHGSSLSRQEIFKILSEEFFRPIEDISFAVGYDPDNETEFVTEYGIVMGRFQPFHFGHQHIINEIILSGKKPLVLLGNDSSKDLKKNPLTVSQRISLINQVFPGECEFEVIEDNENWTEWFSEILKVANPKNCSLFYHNKPEDCYSTFECNGKKYENSFYTEIFRNYGFSMKEVEFVERSDIHIDADAKNIRENFEAFKHLMDGRNYWTLKGWGW